MNKTHKLLAILLGIALIVLLFLLPRKVEVEQTEEAVSEHADHNHEDGEMQVELEAALQLISGEAPMQGILALRDVADKYPNEPEPQFYLGMFAMQTSQFEKAVERFSNVVSLNSNYPDVWKMLGQAFLELSQLEESKDAFQKHLDLNPDVEDKIQIEQIIEEISKELEQ